jgi:hypothetical protein
MYVISQGKKRTLNEYSSLTVNTAVWMHDIEKVFGQRMDRRAEVRSSHALVDWSRLLSCSVPVSGCQSPAAVCSLRLRATTTWWSVVLDACIPFDSDIKLSPLPQAGPIDVAVVGPRIYYSRPQ